MLTLPVLSGVKLILVVQEIFISFCCSYMVQMQDPCATLCISMNCCINLYALAQPWISQLIMSLHGECFSISIECRDHRQMNASANSSRVDSDHMYTLVDSAVAYPGRYSGTRVPPLALNGLSITHLQWTTRDLLWHNYHWLLFIISIIIVNCCCFF